MSPKKYLSICNWCCIFKFKKVNYVYFFLGECAIKNVQNMGFYWYDGTDTLIIYFTLHGETLWAEMG